MATKLCALVLILCLWLDASCGHPSLLGDLPGGGASHHHAHHAHHEHDAEQLPRQARQEAGDDGIIDFTDAYDDPSTGLKCVDKTATVSTKEQERLLECVHSQINVCHYTYVTKFTSQRQDECADNYEKICAITFKQAVSNETIRHCYRPMVQECNDTENSDAEEVCQTVFESECTTKYVEKQPGKFVGDTQCTKLPKELCGRDTCQAVEGPEECHNKTTANSIDVPEEVCDLVPQKTCKGVYKLVPYLIPEPVCEDVPREVCSFGVKGTQLGEKPIVTKWCFDPKDGDPSQNLGPVNRDREEKAFVNANRNKPTLPTPERIIASEGPNRAPEVVDIIYDYDYPEEGAPPPFSPEYQEINALPDFRKPTTPATTPKPGTQQRARPGNTVGTASADIQDIRGGRTIARPLKPADLEALNRVIADYENKDQKEDSGEYEYYYTDEYYYDGSGSGDYEYYYDEEYESEEKTQSGAPENLQTDTTNKAFSPVATPSTSTAAPEVPGLGSLAQSNRNRARKPLRGSTRPRPSSEEAATVPTPSATSPQTNQVRAQAQTNPFVRQEKARKSSRADPEGPVSGDRRSPFAEQERLLEAEDDLDFSEGGAEDLIGSKTAKEALKELHAMGQLELHEDVPDGLEPIIEAVRPNSKDSIKIAQVKSKQAKDHAEKSALAKVIKHKDGDVGKTIIIKNTPEAFKVFGIKNVPKEFFDKAKELVRDGARPLTPEPVLLGQGQQQAEEQEDTTTLAPQQEDREPKTIDADTTEKGVTKFSELVSPNGVELPSSTPGPIDQTPSPSFLSHGNTGNTHSSDNPFLTSPKPRLEMVHRGTPSWHRIQPVVTPLGARPILTTDSNGQLHPNSVLSLSEQPVLQLKDPSSIVIQTPSTGNRNPRVHTFIRKPEVTAAQNFAVPNHPPGPTKVEQARTQKAVALQNTIRTHHQIIKPTNFRERNPFSVPLNEPGLTFPEDSGTRTSRQPSNDNGYNPPGEITKGAFSPPATLQYGFKPMTTPGITDYPTSRPQTQGSFSAPSSLHYGFSPVGGMGQGKGVTAPYAATLQHQSPRRPYSQAQPQVVSPGPGPAVKKPSPPVRHGKRVKKKTMMDFIQEMLEPLTKPIKNLMG